jgi:hypothetical protein
MQNGDNCYAREPADLVLTGAKYLDQNRCGRYAGNGAWAAVARSGAGDGGERLLRVDALAAGHDAVAEVPGDRDHE